MSKALDIYQETSNVINAFYFFHKLNLKTLMSYLSNPTRTFNPLAT